MEAEQLREIFCIKIKLELEQYQRHMLRRTPNYVFQHAYQIDAVVSIYEELLELSSRIPLEALQLFVAVPNILCFLYHRWKEWKEDGRTAMEECLQNTIREMENVYGELCKQEKEGIAA